MDILKHGLFEDIIEHDLFWEQRHNEYLRLRSPENDLILLKYSLTEGHEIEEHFHDWLEFTFVLDGEQKITVNNRDYTLCSGDFLMVNYGEIHSSVCIRPVEKLTLQIRRGYLENYSPLFDASKILCSTSLITSPEQYYSYRNLVSFFSKMCSTFLEARGNPTLAFKGYCCLFLDELMRSMLNQSPDRSRRGRYLEEILYILNIHYSQEITLNDLAEELNLAPEYVSRLLKKELGMGFKEYLTKLRLDHACVLLRTTKKSMLEISETCGFPSVKSFNSYFRTNFGMTPSSWRKDRLKPKP